jgi:DNA-binding response OmpR family regulator
MSVSCKPRRGYIKGDIIMNKILIVDDEESTRLLYAEELSEEGYDVITTNDCARLMDLIKQQKPDLIVLDIRLGGYDGLDLLQEIRNTYYEIPVILCSAYSIYKYDIKSIAADYYVIKSYNLAELKLKIKKALDSVVQFQQMDEGLTGALRFEGNLVVKL